ncbi:coiled-coil domain-containing protein 62 isoform X2 [Eublepharis macularius]|uniref:Coiled-coil domain-containing protein 62 isoform X2 n=1 Tax=Eublepharis macularius TaxID=481883 RepID=A0AA97LEN3_EUBMA|nr:coiled-coil domain-containing protein 62 isoform X2 [Eublepharis macularius]
MNSLPPLSSSPQKLSCEPESVTIQKQRKELQLLIAELKDRDKELNDMVAVHQRQLLAWDEDRQKILTLAERCNRMENELHKRHEMITTLTKRLKLLESQQNDRQMTLENTQQKLQELSQKANDTSLHCHVLEEKNQVLSCSVMELSNKVGHLQAREQELLTMLKLKDKDILEATTHITEFTCKFKMLESALRAARMEESSVSKEKQDFKLKLKELTLETSKLKEDLSEKTKENNEQREEIIRLKQENNYLNNELMFSVEKANRKDHLLQSAKSKQLRTDTELNNLRQIYMKQQQDLQFLHFSLESSQETKQKPKEEAHEESLEMVLSDLESNSERETVDSEISQKIHTPFVCIPKSSLQNACQMCRAETRQQAQALGSQERPSKNLDPFQEGTFHGSRTLPREEQKQEGPLSAGGTESRPTSQVDSTWMMDGREFALAPEQNPVTPLPMHEHWLELSSFTKPANRHSPLLKCSDKLEGGCNAAEADAVGIASGQSPQNSPHPARVLDPACSCHCSVSKTLLCQSVTDREWMQIFKPAKAEGGSWHGAHDKNPQASRGIKSTKSESCHDLDLTFSDLGAPCLTSTQKTSGPKRHEKLFESDLSPKLPSLTDVEAINGCCHPAIHYDSCSPTSKLQRLLAESRQMVADLERSNLLHASPCHGPNNGSPQATGEYPGRLLAAEENQMKLSLFSL